MDTILTRALEGSIVIHIHFEIRKTMFDEFKVYNLIINSLQAKILGCAMIQDELFRATHIGKKKNVNEWVETRAQEAYVVHQQCLLSTMRSLIKSWTRHPSLHRMLLLKYGQSMWRTKEECLRHMV